MVPIDWQLTDSYYVVAHFHYVLFGGTVFAMFAGVYYWFPKITGRMLDERWGKVHFWLTFIGFNLTFMIQHVLGMLGMPRRVFTYPALPGWAAMNMISTIGAFVLALLGADLHVSTSSISLRSGKIAGDNPWDAWTLEWATTSPPPPENLRPRAADSRPPTAVGPRPSGSHRRNDDEAGRVSDRAMPAKTMPDKTKLGVGLFLLSEANFFLILLITYVYFHSLPADGPSAANSLNAMHTLVFSVCLFLSSATIQMAARSFRRAIASGVSRWLALTVALGAIFLFGQTREYLGLFAHGVTISTNLFGSTFFTLTGFHGLHVLIGLVRAGRAAGYRDERAARRRSSRPASSRVAMYWHFVDAVWVVIFTRGLSVAADRIAAQIR